MTMRWSSNPVTDFKTEQTLHSALAILGMTPTIPPVPGTAGYELAKARHVVKAIEDGEMAKAIDEIVDLKLIKKALEKLLVDPDPEVMDKALNSAAKVIAALCKASKAPTKDAAPQFDQSLD